VKSTKLLKSFSKNNNGLIEIIYIAVYLGIAVAVGAITLFVTSQVVDITGTPSGTSSTAASGALTFTGNVSNGELVNITNGVAVYRFEFNTTAAGSAATCLTTNCVIVNLTPGYNSSVKASGNLTAAINANVSVAAFVTAVNTTNTTTITADTAGSAGNSIGTVETLAAASWGAATLTGGSDANTANQHISNASENLLDTADVGYGFLPIVAVAAIGAIAIGYVFGLIPGMGRNKDSGGGI
jgi:hypothetical protein